MCIFFLPERDVSLVRIRFLQSTALFIHRQIVHAVGSSRNDDRKRSDRPDGGIYLLGNPLSLVTHCFIRT